MDKNYFLNRLNNGEDMTAIGAEIAEAMNAAIFEYNKRLEEEVARREAEAKAENRKKEIIKEIAMLSNEWCDLEGVSDPNDRLSEEDIEEIVNISLKTADLFKKMQVNLEPHNTTTKNKSDDDILSEFIKIFN